jgi:CO/xanthine dehydrogenase Mo-binding subunit
MRATPDTVGRPLPRLDGGAKVTGRFEYGVDASRPGMLWARLARSPHAHARIRSIDTAAALAVPGVRAIITGADTVGHMASRYVRDEPILAHRRVRYPGEPVAAVAADTEEAAEEACRLIEVEYEPLPAVGSIEEALAPDAPIIHPDWEDYWVAPIIRRPGGNVVSHASLRRGDLDSAFAEADHVFEDTYEVPMVHQASLEGRVAIAEVAASGDVHVWSSHQYPFGLRQDISDILHIPLSKIRVTVTGVGGGFGGKLYAGVEPYCILLAQRTGRPVKLRYTREEELTATSPRMGASVRLRTAVAADGTLLGREGWIDYDSGAYSESSPGVVSVGVMTLAGPYRWKALAIDTRAIYTNKAGCGSYRGPGAPQAVFAGESQLDRIAEELGIDPMQLRLQNAVRDGDLGPTGQVLENVSLVETIEAAAERIGWATAGTGDARGRGMACTWWTTTGMPSSAYIRVDEDGSFVLFTGATEIGTGAVTAGVAQICAGELGIDPSDLKIQSADTEATPYDFGAQGSRTMVQAGNAAIAAADDLKAQMFDLAAEKLACSADDLDMVDGEIRHRDDPEISLTVADVARLGGTRGGLLGRGSYEQPPTEFDGDTVVGAMIGAFNIPSFATHMCEVTVDRDTGHVGLDRYVVAQDVGRVVNPTYCAGQVTGGAVQGIGQAMFEELVHDAGRVLNPNLTDYKLPTLADLPTIETVLVEVPSSSGPYGAKGVGEQAIIGPPPAIANAVRHAVGVAIRRLPVTAERVWMALHPEHT